MWQRRTLWRACIQDTALLSALSSDAKKQMCLPDIFRLIKCHFFPVYLCPYLCFCILFFLSHCIKCIFFPPILSVALFSDKTAVVQISVYFWITLQQGKWFIWFYFLPCSLLGAHQLSTFWPCRLFKKKKFFLLKHYYSSVSPSNMQICCWLKVQEEISVDIRNSPKQTHPCPKGSSLS